MDTEVRVKVEDDSFPSPVKLEPYSDESDSKPQPDYHADLKSEFHIVNKELHIKDEHESVNQNDQGDEETGTKPRKDDGSFQCHHCSYETKKKPLLKSHLAIHRQVSEAELFSCQRCSYRTRHKQLLKRHQLVHIDSSEMEMFSCGSCDYQTKYKRNLKSHKCAKGLRRYRGTPVAMLKCDSCDYETKLTKSLKRHKLSHLDVSEVEMFSCHSCSYQTRHKALLKSHCRIHLGNAPKYKCLHCPYVSQRKHLLALHVWKHRVEKGSNDQTSISPSKTP